MRTNGEPLLWVPGHIQDSKAVKARLKAIDQPRTVLQALNSALGANKLDEHPLQRALDQVKDCPSRADLIVTSEKVATLLSAIKKLEVATVNGRKAHAQLLVSGDHDITHIAKLENELAAFSHVTMETRGDLAEPKNVEEVRQLLQKWKREEGPSRELKAAVAGSDIDTLRRAIPAAKESGIGIKAAKKRLAALELSERIRSELDTALASNSTSKLEKAVKSAGKAGIEVKEAKAVLKELQQRDRCRDDLAQAIKGNNEGKLETAIEQARKHDVDCAAAQEQLDALMKKRLMDSMLKQEARAARRLYPQKFLMFLPHFRLYEVVWLHMCFIPYEYRKISEMLLELTKLCEIK